MEAVLPTQVVGDVGEGRARRLGHSVVDDDHVVFVHRWRRRVPAADVLTVTLLHLGQLVSGDRLLCRGKTNEMFFRSLYTSADEWDFMRKNNPGDTFQLCLHFCLYFHFFNLLDSMQ